MTNPERQSNFRPSKNLLKRIDIGLTTGIIAVFISFLALITSFKQTQMAQETNKASVLPIIEVNLGYDYNYGADVESVFEITLRNSGAGIAHIQRATPMLKGEAALDDDTFILALMNGRMRSNAVRKDTYATGFLSPGEKITPLSFNWGGSLNARGEIQAYERGQFGTPLEGVDVEVCFCSVYNDCWVSSYLNRKKPREVASCGAEDAQLDGFQSFMEQRAARRMAQ